MTYARNAIAAAILLGAAAPASAATLQSQFTFDSALTDSVGSATATGAGDVTGGRYAFDPNEGLTVTLGTTLSDWSIILSGAFDNVTGYNKLLDLAGLGSDNGLYVRNSDLVYYNQSQPDTDPISAGTDFIAALTFDGTTTRGYVNGAQQFTFATGGAGYPGALSSFIVAQDDAATAGNESSAGTLDFLQVYAGVLTDNEVAAITGPAPTTPAVPLPATGLLMLAGMGGLTIMRRRSA